MLMGHQYTGALHSKAVQFVSELSSVWLILTLFFCLFVCLNADQTPESLLCDFKNLHPAHFLAHRPGGVGRYSAKGSGFEAPTEM